MVMMFLIVIIPTFAASIFLLLNMRSTIRESAFNTVLNDSDSIKYRITDIIESAQAVSKSVSSDRSIIDFLNNSFTDKSEYYSYYYSSRDDYSSYSPQIQRVLFFSEREDFVYGSNFIYASESLRETYWYKQANQSPESMVWGVVTNPANGRYCLSCIKAVTDGGETLAVSAVLISDAWIERMLSDKPFSIALAAGNGSVYFSTYGGIAPGDALDAAGELSAPNLRSVYEYGYFGSSGYTVINNFYYGGRFQIIIGIPSRYVDYEVNRLSVVYGGYCALMTALSILITILFTSVFSKRINLLSEKMHAVAEGNFDIEFTDKGNDEISALYSDLGQMINDMQRLINDNYQARLQSEAFRFNQMEAEFKALSSQINPHFLYNTLETIRMKAYCNNDKETADLVKKLGKFMRRCLEFKDGEVTLRSELEFTEGYLELQSARFGDRVSYNIYSEIAKDYMVLPLIIQPVAENAFVHGIEGSKSNGRIEIKAYYHGKYVMIDISDNGQGMSKEKLSELERKLEISDTSSGKSIGLSNVNKRIKMYHGEKYGLTIFSKEGKGTTIRISLPREPVSKIAIREG